MTPSSVQSQSALSILVIQNWYSQMVEVHIFLERLFELEFPEEYAVQQKLYSAAKWCQMDPGPYLG